MLKLKNSGILKTLMIFLEITFLIMIIISLPGCKKEIKEDITPDIGVETPNKNDEGIVSPFKKVNTPAPLPYIVENNLEHIYKDTEQESLYSFTGLLDSSLEQAINTEIEKRHNLSKNGPIPPYRGIKKVIDTDELPRSVSTYTMQSFSGFNLLSIRINTDRTYSGNNPLNDLIYTNTYDSYNVDLSTGEEIKIRDLFADNVDYKTIINDYIIKEVNRRSNIEENDGFSDEQLTMVYPFTGIKDDQKFVLTPYDLEIIIDYETPEFNTNFTYNIIRIPFRDLNTYLAIKERFFDDLPSLYQSPAQSKQLIPYFPPNIIGKNEEIVKDSLTIIYNSKYPEDTPLVWSTIFLENSILDYEKIEQIQKEYPEQSFYMVEYFGEIIGPYFNIRETSVFSNEVTGIFTSKDTLYDNKGAQVKLGDLFIPNFSFDKIINEHLRVAIDENGNLRNKDFKTIRSTLSFGLSSNAYTFTTGPLDLGEGQIYPISFYIDYSEFGNENLVFFNDNP